MPVRVVRPLLGLHQDHPLGARGGRLLRAGHPRAGRRCDVNRLQSVGYAVTFALLCFVPLWVLGVSALHIHSYVIDDAVGGAGVLLYACGLLLYACGLLYGGYWRIQMQRRSHHRIWFVEVQDYLPHSKNSRYLMNIMCASDQCEGMGHNFTELSFSLIWKILGKCKSVKLRLLA